MPKLILDFDPFENAGALKRLLKRMTLAILAGDLYPRQAGAVRSLVGMWLRVGELERLDLLEARIEQLEKQQGVAKE